MSKKPIDLEQKVTAVWLIQGDKRFLLNYFHSFKTACGYVNAFSHFKINGQVVLGECTLRDLISE